MKNRIIICSALLLMQFCNRDKVSINSIESGSDLDSQGMISNHEMVYHIEKYMNKGRVKDLFNYIYFKGYTVCISAKLNFKMKDISKGSIIFINPKTGKEFPAEKVTVNGNRISGFSLLGSLLESFYGDELKKSIPSMAYCCREIPFIALIKVKDDKFETEKKSRFTFKIIYK